MKFHLRNLAMVAALAATTATFAQESTDAPTVTMKWRHSFNAEAHDVRGGCAAQGKVYYADGTDNAIYTVDAEGNVELFYKHDGAINRGFTCDDEGNVMICPSWATSADNINNWLLIKASDKSTSTLDIDFVDLTPARGDMFGRTVGDIFSEDGGICYMTVTGAQFPLPLWVAEGEQIVPSSIGGFEFPAATNMTYAVPAFGTMDQFFDEFDEPALAGACYYRVFNGNPTYTTNFVESDEGDHFDVVTIPEPNLPDGYAVKQISFETFQVAGTRYFCCGVSNEGKNWGSNFCIYDGEGNVLFISDNGSAQDSENKYNSDKTGNGGGLVARQIDENTVELYQLYACGDATKKNFAAMYEIKVEGEEPEQPVEPTEPTATRKAFAYGLKAVAGENGIYTITYNSSADAKEAVLVLTDGEGNPTNITIPAPKAGENSVEVNLSDLAVGTYNWAINVVSESEADGVVYTSEEVANLYATGNRDKSGRLHGGAVWMNDAEYDSYGYTVIGLGASNGYFVFDPAGKLLNESAVHAGESNATNASSTFRGDALRDKAVFADWSDSHSGYWAIDPLNLDAPRYNMLMPEGATQASSGLVTYNGVQTGSGSACVAFGGRGEETMMYGYDEDIYSNQVVGYALGTANYITEAPVLEKIGPYTSFSLNCEIKATDAYHIWVNMGRSNGNDSGSTVCLAYYEITKDTMTDDDGEDVLVYTSEQLWNSAGKDLFEDGTQGTFAVSPDGKTIVADSQNGKMLYVLDVEFNQWGEPEVTINRTIDVTEYKQFDSTVARGQMAFDAAGNLHYNNVFGQTYQVWSLKGQSVATTPAKSADVLTVASGVENLNAAQDAPVEYFNLNGVRVAADNLTPGLYIRRQGTQATKVLVK